MNGAQILVLIFCIVLVIGFSYFTYEIMIKRTIVQNDISSHIKPTGQYDKITSVMAFGTDCGWYNVYINVIDCDNGKESFCSCTYNENTHQLVGYNTSLIVFNTW